MRPTQRSKVKIGKRGKPQPQGQPGYIRIDTVHQGDQDKQKGVYHINGVDEVTQYEVMVTVEQMSEPYLIPALERLLEVFPCVVLPVHSDCGSEYVNHTVVTLLNKLHIAFTKSRSRHCNDNALAEFKNGCMVRKYFGYRYIPKKWAPWINVFNTQALIPYLNFHRPCYFATVITDAKGKEKKIYPYKNMMTLYERFKSWEKSEQFLKPGMTFEALDQQMMEKTDWASACALRLAQKKLLAMIFATGPLTCALPIMVSVDNT